METFNLLGAITVVPLTLMSQKLVFHPVDFLIFNGMKEKNSIDNLVLFDREVRDAAQKALQKSVEKTVEKENYEWITMQVSEDGSVEYK